jgi:hypothetical protein
MKLLAHRGHWQERTEMNSPRAFQRAWSAGFGIETDLRDLDGSVVISHDPASRGACTLTEFLAAYAEHGTGTTLALNIKADGLQRAVEQAVRNFGLSNLFFFDMSVPDSLHYLRAGLPVLVRLSEFEPETALLARARGVWLDAFEGEWWTLDTIRSLHSRGKSVALVSPELHGRPHAPLWRTLKSLETEVQNALMLCTDFPDAASEVFRP